MIAASPFDCLPTAQPSLGESICRPYHQGCWVVAAITVAAALGVGATVPAATGVALSGGPLSQAAVSPATARTTANASRSQAAQRERRIAGPFGEATALPGRCADHGLYSNQSPS
jgi:hypothetical protein